jgi:hypothetical protein
MNISVIKKYLDNNRNKKVYNNDNNKHVFTIESCILCSLGLPWYNAKFRNLAELSDLPITLKKILY